MWFMRIFIIFVCFLTTVVIYFNGTSKRGDLKSAGNSVIKISEWLIIGWCLTCVLEGKKVMSCIPCPLIDRLDIYLFNLVVQWSLNYPDYSLIQTPIIIVNIEIASLIWIFRYLDSQLGNGVVWISEGPLYINIFKHWVTTMDIPNHYFGLN